ncbi:hypothetical protein ACJ73_08450 [Blastomyces percursus]|uniref:Uncharacterized protein n=1 Tax=Blastomyces percursus TaxID=1658174 RepID=A0A1J9PUZ8_9EURO|nr:hypothetical protein ACJ73_08450 [Blastomyces percursus]
MGGIKKFLLTGIEFTMGHPADLKKFFKPTVARGKTVCPKPPADLLSLGFGGITTRWRENHGGTYSVMTNISIFEGVEVDKEIFERQARDVLEKSNLGGTAVSCVRENLLNVYN